MVPVLQLEYITVAPTSRKDWWSC